MFESWNSERAKEYRKLNKIDDSMGTAVNVQAMVFGNMGDTSGSGVLFTRNPSTGEKMIMAEYLPTRRAKTWSPASAPRRSWTCPGPRLIAG